jgi:hypothetical protein
MPPSRAASLDARLKQLRAARHRLEGSLTGGARDTAISAAHKQQEALAVISGHLSRLGAEAVRAGGDRSQLDELRRDQESLTAESDRLAALAPARI